MISRLSITLTLALSPKMLDEEQHEDPRMTEAAPIPLAGELIQVVRKHRMDLSNVFSKHYEQLETQLMERELPLNSNSPESPENLFVLQKQRLLRQEA